MREGSSVLRSRVVDGGAMMAPMGSLGVVIARRVEEWEALDLLVEREVFGTTQPEELAAVVDAWCRVHLCAPIARYEFFESSSGSVHGVALTNGRRVVVKGHRAAVTGGYLTAVTAVQAALADSGYPAPRPLVGPIAVGVGHVTAETMLDRSAGVDGHDPAVRRAVAAGLARFVALTRGYRRRLERVMHPMSVPDGDLYPIPHSPRFDFASTVAGAGWIDDLAARARARLRSLPNVDAVVVHGDWRVENLCVRANRLVAVYDWDSVHVASEVAAVASAAITFSVDWQQRHGNRFPRPHEIDAFVSDYQAARGTRFSAIERQHLAAMMVTSLSYGARCEHADPLQRPSDHDSQCALLETLGEPLLENGLAALQHMAH